MSSDNEVLCAGILVADHVCTPMRRLPDEGLLEAVDAMYLLTGGCAANVAVNVAKQGIRAGVAGKVGDDIWGRFVREDLSTRQVDTQDIQVSTSHQTSQSMILLCRGQDRRFVHSFGANGDFRVGDIDRSRLAHAKVLYVGGYLVMPAMLPPELADLFRHCREHGIRTVLDVVVPADFSYRDELAPVLPYTDVFLPNDDEARLLTGETDPVQQALALRSLGAETVVVTQGGDGLVFAAGQRVWRAEHFPSEVVDQTGAGDAFCAGFISGMVRGLSLEECVHYGSALGASCVRSIGCYDGVFNAEQAARFMAKYPLRVQSCN